MCDRQTSKPSSKTLRRQDTYLLIPLHHLRINICQAFEAALGDGHLAILGIDFDMGFLPQEGGNRPWQADIWVIRNRTQAIDALLDEQGLPAGVSQLQRAVFTVSHELDAAQALGIAADAGIRFGIARQLA